MKIGHARIDITPAEGSTFYLLGYKTPLRNEPAEGIHDHIYCNSILFDNGNDRAFLLTADLLEIPDVTADAIRNRLSKKFGISKSNIVIGVMHDHSSIRDFHVDWEFGRFSPTYYDFFLDCMEQSFAQCERNLQEATAEYGSESITGYYSNRNHPGKPADNEVTVIRFRNTAGDPFAAIVCWAVHSTVMGASNRWLTGDMAGGTCRKLGEKWGYYPVMVNGAAGDSSNRYDRQGSGFDELERVTDGLAQAISAIPTGRHISFENNDSIRHIDLTEEIVTDQEQYHKELRKMIQDIRNGKISVSGNLPPQHLLDKCEEQLKQPPFRLSLKFEVLDVGPLRLDIFPGELGSAFGIQLKAAFPDRPVIVAGYSNGFHYYFLAKEDYGKSFETIGNPVPPGTAEDITRKFIEAGQELDRTRE